MRFGASAAAPFSAFPLAAPALAPFLEPFASAAFPFAGFFVAAISVRLIKGGPVPAPSRDFRGLRRARPGQSLACGLTIASDAPSGNRCGLTLEIRKVLTQVLRQALRYLYSPPGDGDPDRALRPRPRRASPGVRPRVRSARRRASRPAPSTRATSLEMSSGRYFLRIYEEQQRPGAEAEARLLLHLAASGVPTPAPVQARDGTMVQVVCGKPAAIFPWVDGDMLCLKAVTPGRRPRGRRRARPHAPRRPCRARRHVARRRPLRRRRARRSLRPHRARPPTPSRARRPSPSATPSSSSIASAAAISRAASSTAISFATTSSGTTAGSPRSSTSRALIAGPSPTTSP